MPSLLCHHSGSCWCSENQPQWVVSVAQRTGSSPSSPPSLQPRLLVSWESHNSSLPLGQAVLSPGHQHSEPWPRPCAQTEPYQVSKPAAPSWLGTVLCPCTTPAPASGRVLEVDLTGTPAWAQILLSGIPHLPPAGVVICESAADLGPPQTGTSASACGPRGAWYPTGKQTRCSTGPSSPLCWGSTALPFSLTCQSQGRGERKSPNPPARAS